MLDLGAEVCPNAGLSHRNLSKHEKNSPPPDLFGQLEGYFLKLYYFMLFLFAKIKMIPERWEP